MITKAFLVLVILSGVTHADNTRPMATPKDEKFSVTPWKFNENAKTWVTHIGDGEYISTVTVTRKNGITTFLVYRDCPDNPGMVTSVIWKSGAPKGRYIPCTGSAYMSPRVRVIEEAVSPLPPEILASQKK